MNSIVERVIDDNLKTTHREDFKKGFYLQVDYG